MITSNPTDPPVELWRMVIRRNGRLFISSQTLAEIDIKFLDLFCMRNCLKQVRVYGGIMLKPDSDSK